MRFAVHPSRALSRICPPYYWIANISTTGPSSFFFFSERGDLLGCSSDDALQSLDFSLCLQRIVLSRHLLVAEAAILHAVGVVEEEAGFVVLDTRAGQSGAATRREEVRMAGDISPHRPSLVDERPGTRSRGPWRKEKHGEFSRPKQDDGAGTRRNP